MQSTINNTCLMVLPYLLDRTKEQTIRKHDNPKYSVGQKIQLVWNEEKDKNIKGNYCVIGEAEITKRTELLIRKEGNDYLCYERKNKRERWVELSIGVKQELSVMDGFKTFKDLINYFEKEHKIDFTEEKEFYRYQYKWI